MIIRYSPFFLRALKKANVRIRKSFKEKILIFAKSPDDLELDNHSLTEPYAGFRSIDITSDWRAIYEQKGQNEETIAYFVLIGSHKDLYNKSK